MTPDKLLVIYYKDGNQGYCEPNNVATVDAALSRLVADGAERFSDDDLRDSLLRLTAISGDPLVVIASSLIGYSLSTKESRRRKAIYHEAVEHENDDLKSKSAALPDEAPLPATQN